MTAGYGKQSQGVLENPEALLSEYLPLIRYHVGQLIQRVPDSIEYDDLTNAGVLGLLDAANRFDVGRGIQFSTFVAYRVRGAMIDYLRDFDWFPRSLRDTAKEVQKVLVRLEQAYGRPASEEEIARELGLSVNIYREKLNNIKGMTVVYFDDLPSVGEGEDACDILEAMAGDFGDMPEHMATMHEFMQRLGVAIENLPMRERIVLTLYYYEELNMKEVALVLGLTESRVSQVHSQLVLRLRGMLNLELPDAHQ